MQSSRAIITMCRMVGQLGFEHLMFIVPNLHTIRPMEILAREVIPAIAEF